MKLKGTIGNRRIFIPLLVFPPGVAGEMHAIDALALLDTGATRSALGRSIVEALKLEPITKGVVKFGDGERMMDFYAFRFGFVDAEQSNPAPYVLDEVSGFGFHAEHKFDAILGMDVLEKCDFSLSRNGAWSLTLPG